MQQPTAPRAARVVLPGDRPPWTDSGLRVRRGERVTLLGSGRIGWSTGDGAGARHHLWGRVPGGTVFGCTRDTTTVVADRDGPLQLCVHLGRWADPGGAVVPGSARYGPDRGALHVTVLIWPPGTDPVTGLGRLAPDLADPALVAAERARLSDPVVPPAGWRHGLDLGPSEVFRHARDDGRPAVDVRCEDTAAVLERDVDVPLVPGLRLGWSWRVEQLPGTGPENVRARHDHVGIGAGFDTGHDLNWFWSTVLRPDDDAFRCPVPGRPLTHVPVRRGPAGLGRWRHESRDLWADHRTWLGPAPDRVTRVSLLAVSHFGHGTAAARFRDIGLHVPGGPTVTL